MYHGAYFCLPPECFLVLLGDVCSFPSDGHNLKLHQVFMYNCQLCPYYNHCGGPQGRQIHNSWVLLTRRSSSTLSECEWIGDLHSRWFVVFACLRANGNCITYTLWKNNGIWTRAKPLNVDTAKKLILVSLFYNGNVAFSLASLKGVNIPMYIAIKRLTPLAVLIAVLFIKKGNNQNSLSCIFVI